VEQYCDQWKQQRHEDGTSSHQWEGKQKMDPEEDKDEGLGFQQAKRDLKAVYVHFDSEFSDNKHRKMLYIMFGGSWDITSRRIIKILH
jgi:hypothetical protein